MSVSCLNLLVVVSVISRVSPSTDGATPSMMKSGIDINRQGGDESVSSVNRNSPKVFYELGVCLFCEIGSDRQIVIAVKELLGPFELTPSRPLLVKGHLSVNKVREAGFLSFFLSSLL